MPDKITKVFNAIAAAQNIESVQKILKTVETFSNAEQADFVRRLRTEFSTRSRPGYPDAFTVMAIEPLDSADLRQGYRIGFKNPRP